MKKLSIVLLLLLALTLCLTACNKADATSTLARWFDEEHYSYAITLADFDADSKESTDGKKWTKELITDTEKKVVSNKNYDEIVPVDATGELTIDISVVDRVCTLTISQTVYCKYLNETVLTALNNDETKLENWQSLKAACAVTEPDAGIAVNTAMFEENISGHTILKSTTTSVAVFRNEATQTPISSSKVINGYYLGKSSQEVNTLNVETSYDLSGKKLVATVVTNGEKVVNKVKYSTSTNIIDANQIFLYMRSLEKTKSMSQNSPSVQIYDPLTNTLLSGTLSFQYEYKTIVKYGAATPVTLSATVISVDGMPFMVQFSIPDTVNKVRQLDGRIVSGVSYNRYTVLRFRSGCLSFEMLDYDNSLMDSSKQTVLTVTDAETLITSDVPVAKMIFDSLAC